MGSEAYQDKMRELNLKYNPTFENPTFEGYATGGISTGPMSGHMELLHGTELITPLNGGSIPLRIVGGDSANGEDTKLLREQNELLRKLVAQNGRPFNVAVEVGNEEFNSYIQEQADDLRVKADRRGMPGKRIR